MRVEDVRIAIPCPACSHKLEEVVAWLRQNETTSCTCCGATITLHADRLMRTMEPVD